MKLEGRVALVTGGGRNLGKAIAIALASEGARVAVNGLQNAAQLDGVVDVIQKDGGVGMAALGDVSDADQVKRLVEKVSAELGPIDILVSNAAIRPHGSLRDVTPEEWRRVMAINLDATFYLCQQVVPGMMEKGRGSIIAFSGLVAFGMRGDAPAVAASKAGLIGLIRSVASSYGKYGVRANIIVPGNMATERYDQVSYLEGTPSRPLGGKSEEGMDNVPLRRRGTPEETAATCVFLASDDSGYITGQTIHLGGGLYMA